MIRGVDAVYIDPATIDGNEYAYVVESFRDGKKTKKQKIRYLGRILLRIDKDGNVIESNSQNQEETAQFTAGVFKTKTSGVYFYDLKYEGTGGEIRRVPHKYQYLIPETRRKNAAVVKRDLRFVFGSIFLVDGFIKMCGICSAIDAIRFRNSDTLYCLILYYVLGLLSNHYLADWWERTYAHILYPRASLGSQRVSEALGSIGLEYAKQSFFEEYFALLEQLPPDETSKADSQDSTDTSGAKKLKFVVNDGILIDSTGLPNAAKLPATAVNNHNGNISNEIRLIYVVQQSTGLPLFYRYVPGNVIDASTIKRTIVELKTYDINVNWALLDAGYYNGKNADILIEEGIDFVSRVKSTAKIFTDAVTKYRHELETKDNMVQHNGRMIFVKIVPCKIGSKSTHDAFSYLCMDTVGRLSQISHLMSKAYDDNLSDSEVFDQAENKGIFMLISTKKLERDQVLNLYYTRDQVEKIFEICKGDANVLPINVESEESFRGHLLMTFIASTIVKMMSDELRDTKYTLEYAFWLFSTQTAIQRKDKLLIDEPDKKMKEIYRAFNMECPTEITLPVVD